MIDEDHGMFDEDAIRTRWETFGSKPDERGRRLFAAGKVRAAGWGSLSRGLADHRPCPFNHKIAARTIWMLRRWPKVRCVARAPAAKPGIPIAMRKFEHQRKSRCGKQMANL